MILQLEQVIVTKDALYIHCPLIQIEYVSSFTSDQQMWLPHHRNQVVLKVPYL